MWMSNLKFPFFVTPEGFSLSLVLRKDHRLKMFEKRIVTRIYGRKKRKEWKNGESALYETSRNVTGIKTS
jgi:hypothetical protein